jgi:hypothetical protein
MASPSGTPPKGRDTERELAMAALADAHAKTMALKRGAESVQDELTRTGNRLSQLYSQSKQLVREVLLEDARALGKQNVEALRTVFAVEGALSGIRNVLTRMNDGGGAEAVAVILRGGVVPEPKAQQPEPPARAAPGAQQGLDLIRSDVSRLVPGPALCGIILGSRGHFQWTSIK